MIATCYDGSTIADQQLSLFPEEQNKTTRNPHYIVLTPRDIEGHEITGMDVIDRILEEKRLVKRLKGNGDFRSPECIEFLKEADIVVTNPPFSLFREFVSILMQYEKKYIIWGNNNAITYKEFFPLLKENKMWLGYTANKTCIFQVPIGYRYDERETEKINDGNHYGKVPAISVFTNLDISKRHEKLILWKKYTPEEYSKYDNYDAINVDKVAEIPYDYDGVMGVPITFLDKYNPEQFEILGLTQRGCHDESLETKKYDEYWEMRPDGTRTGASGSKTNGNPNLAMNDGKHNYFINEDGYVVQSCYQRILIRNKHPEKPKELHE